MILGADRLSELAFKKVNDKKKEKKLLFYAEWWTLSRQSWPKAFMVVQ